MKLPYNLSEQSITVFYEGKPYTVRNDNANFEPLKQALLDARYEDVPGYLDMVKAVEDFVEGDIEVRNEVVYYKNHRLHGVVVDKLLEMLRAGMKDSAPLTNFITRLQANPSANSVNELYSFMSYKMLPNTPEGKVLGYKGVADDFYSNTGNADTIVIQGKTNDRHQIYNGVGETIEIARRCVDDNKDNHCSYGLHIGSYDYANNWAGEGGRLLVVEFDPQDAVSVPTDCDFQKLRVSKYKVVEDITDTRKEISRPVYEANKPIYGSDVDDYDSDGPFSSEVDDYFYDDDDSFDSDDEPIDGVWKVVEQDDDDEVTLPEGYGDDDEEVVDEQVTSYKHLSMVDLSIRNYIENKHEAGVNPTIKNIADTKVCRDEGIRCKDAVLIAHDLGFKIERNIDKVTSELEVYPA